jgi:DNA-binding MarR family transcriptional regulator
MKEGIWRRGRPKDFILSGKAKDILLSLYKSPKYFAELLRDIGGSPTAVNANLKDLKEEGLIEDKYIGTTRLINLTEEGVEAVKYIMMIKDAFEKPKIEEVSEVPRNRKKWILLLLYSIEKIMGAIIGIVGTTKLTKLLFLMKRKYNIDNEYNFQPYLYGPFSFEIYEDTEKLESMGLLKIDGKIHEPKNSEDWTIMKVYSLTEKGREIAEKIWNELDEKTKEALLEVAKLNKKNLPEILYHVYKEYPKESGIEE